MAERAIRVAIKKLLAVIGIAGGSSRRLYLHAADISDNLPDFFIGHAHALAVGAVGGHHSSGDAVADYLEHFGVVVRVFLLRPRQVRTAPAAVCAQSMTKRAVDAEFILARFGSFGIVGIRVAIVSSESCSRASKHNDHHGQLRKSSSSECSKHQGPPFAVSCTWAFSEGQKKTNEW